jgi:hypothetical protein
VCQFISLTLKIENGITLSVAKYHRINYTDKQGVIEVILRKYFVVNSGHFCRPGSFCRSLNRPKQPFGLQFSFLLLNTNTGFVPVQQGTGWMGPMGRDRNSNQIDQNHQQHNTRASNQQYPPPLAYV